MGYIPNEENESLWTEQYRRMREEPGYRPPERPSSNVPGHRDYIKETSHDRYYKDKKR